jgi:hypothetical protein
MLSIEIFDMHVYGCFLPNPNYFLLMEFACQFGHNNENANRNIAGVDSGDLASWSVWNKLQYWWYGT